MVCFQDFFIVVQYIFQNFVGNKLVWDWICLNWDYLVNRCECGILFYILNLVYLIFFFFYDFLRYK